MSKLGRIKVPDPVGYHPVFGELKFGQIVELPDDWDFDKETLCEPAEETKKKKKFPEANE